MNATDLYVKPCPHCGEPLEFVDCADSPVGWIDPEGRDMFECPACEGRLD